MPNTQYFVFKILKLSRTWLAESDSCSNMMSPFKDLWRWQPLFALLAKTATLKAEVEKKHSGKWNDDKKLRRQKTRRNKESWKTFLFFISFSLVFCLSWTSFAISVLEKKKTLGRISIVPNLMQILLLPGRCSSVVRVSFKGPNLVQLYWYGSVSCRGIRW